MTSLRGFWLAMFGLVAAGGPPAVAGPITVTFEGVSPGSGNAGQYNWNSGATTHAGMVYTPHGNGSSSANHFVAFCIERDQHISGGTTYTGYRFSTLPVSPVPGAGMGAATADAIRSMWAEFRDDLDAGTAADRADKSAAFQHAVWHLLDGAHSPGLGGAKLGYYTQFLTPGNWVSGKANLATIISANSQDQIIELTPGTNVVNNQLVTPEPASLVIGLLVAPAVLLRRRLATRVK